MTIETKITEILETHCMDAHPSFKHCQQQTDLVELFKDESKAQLMELLGEKEPETITIDDPAHPTIFDKAAFTRNQFRDQLLAKISGDRKG